MKEQQTTGTPLAEAACNEELRTQWIALGKELKKLFGGERTLIHIFYRRADGTVNNLSISQRRAKTESGRMMNDEELCALMEGYPDTRGAQVLAVDRPGRDRREWIDRAEAMQMLHTSVRTLQRWADEGLLRPSRLHGKVYYDRREVDALLQSNLIEENGRIDRTALALMRGDE